jgi:hypothetical protein
MSDTTNEKTARALFRTFRFVLNTGPSRRTKIKNFPVWKVF